MSDGPLPSGQKAPRKRKHLSGGKRAREVPVEQYESLKREFELQEKTLASLTVEFMSLKKSEWGITACENMINMIG